jgi:hypothetical protein
VAPPPFYPPKERRREGAGGRPLNHSDKVKNILFKAVFITVMAVGLSNAIFYLLGHETTLEREVIKGFLFFLFILAFTYFQEKRKTRTTDQDPTNDDTV